MTLSAPLCWCHKALHDNTKYSDVHKNIEDMIWVKCVSVTSVCILVAYKHCASIMILII